MTAIFDTHAHYDDDAFNEDREQLLAALPGQGIARVVDVGASLTSCRKVLELMEQYDYIYGAIGVHPSETAELTEESYSWLKEQCQKEKCLAVGEIGLDYYWPEPDHETQKKWFLRQLELAREIKKPVIIHSGCSEGYRGSHDGGARRRDRRCNSLLFLYEGDGAGILKYGFLSWNRRSRNLQKCKEAERGSCHCAAVPDCSGNGLPLHGTGAQSRQEKFFLESALCCRSPGSD